MQVATIAGNNDPTIGNVLADAFLKVGKDGVITVEEGRQSETYVEVVEGMQFDRGYLSPHFVTNQENQTVELENCLDPDLRRKDLQRQEPGAASRSRQQGQQAAADHRRRRRRRSPGHVGRQQDAGILNVCAVKAPGYGDRRKAMLGDLAILTGGTAIFKDLGISLDAVKLSDLGKAKKVTIDAENTTIVGGAGKKEAIDGRAEQIRQEIEVTDSEYDREKLQERLAKLAGGVAQINVGAATETEMKERKALLEDAKAATQAALEEGIVPGGGVALIRCRRALDKLEAHRRREARRRDHPQRARLSAPRDRPERGPRRGRGRQSRPADEGQERRLRRRQGHLLRPDRRRHHRPGQGRPHRSAKRGQRRGPAAHHRVADHRNAEAKKKPATTITTTTAWVAWAEWAAAWVAWVAWAAWAA